MSDLASRIKNLSPAKRRLLEQRLKDRKPTAEPIAIVGMACRFAGAPSLDAYWQLIRDGQSAITEIPASRWNVDDFYDPTGTLPGKMSTRHGAFVDDVDQFDPMFFGIAPREAVKMDPQQRLLLEVAWEALEHAGLSARSMAGSRTGVYVGIGGTDYSKRLCPFQDYYEQIDAHVGTGNALSIASNRISYLFDFRGPSMSVDTACSSALVALHAAVQALRSKECDAALAGGVNLILSPEVTVAFSKARMLSPNGVCRPFDENADGYVRGEGCGLIVLKRLQDAVADGDNVLAVIRATAVNQDGKTSGITAPNGESQKRLIREALAKADLTPDDVSYVEAHGTATPLGDPIEVGALTEVFARHREEDPPCYTTSVKANIGHTETASGIAGLLKTVLMMQHGVIPAQTRLERLNPYISLSGSRIEIPQQEVAWARGNGPRSAGVSSFGFGGTNVHIVLQDPALPDEPASAEQVERPRHLLTLSAKDANALGELVDRYRERIADEGHDELPNICATANQTGNHFPHRVAISATDSSDMCAKLEKVAQGRRGAGIKTGQVQSAPQSGIAFLFTGQGSQYAGMCQQLYQTQPLFRQTLDQCDALLYDQLDQSLLSVIFSESNGDSQLNQTGYTQPALFAVEYALAQLWMSWGIRPSYVLGHSVGEYVAACIADVFSLEDGLQLIAERARLMQQLSTSGSMAVIFADADHVQARLAAHKNLVSIAAVNGPANTVISGDAATVQRLVDEFKQAGIESQPLSVSHAFHSPLMDPILEPFELAADEVDYRSPGIELFSNLTADVAKPDELDAEYWVQHVRQPVRFAESMRALMKRDPAVVIEVGASPQLIGMSRQFIDQKELLWLPSLRQGRDDWTAILESLASLYVSGVEIDWRGFEAGYSRTRVQLPSYPFHRTRQWQDSDSGEVAYGSDSAVLSGQPTIHPLLGQFVPAATDKAIYQSDLLNRPVQYLADHQVQGSIVFPAAGYLEMALAAAQQAFGPGPHLLEGVSIQQAMFLPSDASTRRTQLSVEPEQYGGCRFECHSTSNVEDENYDWTLHAGGRISRQPAEADSQSADQVIQQAESVRQHHVDAKSRDEFYQLMAARELSYGPAFQVLGQTWRTEDQAVAEVELPDSVVSLLGQYMLHPALLDGCFQAAALIVPFESDGSYSPFTYMPVAVDQLRVHRAPTEDMQILARRTSPTESTPSPESVVGDLVLADREGNVIAELVGLKVQRVGQNTKSAEEQSREWLYQINWATTSSEADAPTRSLDGDWLVVADQTGVADRLIARLETEGASVRRVEGSELADGEEPAAVESLQRSLTDLVQDRQLHGVIDLSSLDETLSSRESAQPARSTACISAMRSIQSMAKSGVSGTPSWFVTLDAQSVTDKDRCSGVSQAPLWGLVRCAAIEHPELGCRLVDLPIADSTDELVDRFIEELRRDDDESQVAIRDERYVARLAKSEPLTGGPLDSQSGLLEVPKGQPSQLQIASAGSFDGLYIVPIQRQSPGVGQIEVEVQATGLNFSDVLKALGLYPGITDSVVPLGIECSGVVTAVGDGVDRFKIGDAVVGVVPYGFATHAVTAEFAMTHKPEQLSFSEAATIPITFLTAHYALRQLADLQPSERVLIHAGAGGVGLAAIQIAQDIGAEIFATAGSDLKRDYLRELGVSHVMDSRTLEFADQIRQQTDGEGIDVVLNSLPGDAIDRSLSVLRSYGRFLEIGKTDIYQNRAVGLLPFQDNLSYFAIDLDRMLRQRPDTIRRLLSEVMEYFAEGRYRPLELTSFAYAETRDAFRYMAQRKNIGKVVVSMQSDDGDSDETEAVETPQRTCLITGGLGALGQRVALSYASRRQSHIVLMSRRKPNAEGEAFLDELRSRGVEAHAVQGDVSDPASLAEALGTIPEQFPPLGTIVHAAGVLDDGVLFDMSAERLQRTMAPKVAGAWNLHRATESDDVQEFVLFSSVASVLGSPGQANYAAGNAFLDSLAHHRRAAGLPATTINWGPWAEAGMAIGDNDESQVTSRGMDLLPVDASLDLLHRLTGGSVAQSTVMRVRWQEMLQGYRSAVPKLLSEIAAAYESQEGAAAISVDQQFRGQLLAADSATRIELIREYFVEQLSVIMGLDESDIDPQQPLNSLGLDSLMAIELKNQVETRLGVVLPMAKFMEGPSVVSLSEVVADLVVDQPESTQLTSSSQRGKDGRMPLSYGQQALWFLYKLAPESAAYHICDAVRVRGPLQIEILQRATQAIVDQHGAFRTTFRDDDGRPYQVIESQLPVNVQLTDAVGWSEQQIQQAIAAELERPFDLENGPLLRVAVFAQSAEQHVLVFCVHHIVADFWSLVACTQQFMHIYETLADDRDVDLPHPALDYGSFVDWQSGMLESDEGNEHWSYWQERLAGELPMLNLPTDRPRPAIQSYNGALAFHWLDEELTARLRELADRHGASLNMLLLAVYQCLLHRYSGQNDVIVGLPTSGRARADFADLVGYFVNPVPVRADLAGNPSFGELLDQVRDRTLEALRHQDFPFSLIVDRLNPQRDPSRSTLFQCAFVMQKAQVMHEQGLTPFLMGQSGAELEIADLVFESMTLDQWVAQLDLSLAASEANGGTSLGLQFNSDLFDPATAERFLEHYENALRDIVHDPSTPISQIHLLSETQQHELDAWSTPSVETPTGELVHERIARQARQTPDEIAVVCGDAELTFDQLDRRANQLARYLRESGTGRGDRVGLCLDRSIDLVVAMQAILRAGAAYVPMDPTYPAQRLVDIATGAGMSTIITAERHINSLGEFRGNLICTDRDRVQIDQQSTESLGAIASENDLIYVIYTSGSTGKPKGAGVYHRGFVNLLDWYIDDLQVGQSDNALVITSHGFDLTQKNFYATLMTGGRLHLSQAEVYDPALIRGEIADAKITLLNCTPSHFYGVVDASTDELARLTSLRLVVLGGEAIDLGRLESWFNDPRLTAEIVNSYGPTECTDVVIYHRLSEADRNSGDPIPLGRPIRNVQALVLDEHLGVVPPGATGELCLAGICVGAGYINDADLTSERFVECGHAKVIDGQVYRTGDLCRFRDDGVLEFFGRRDHQVKLRGFRIELGEIEHALMTHPSVGRAVVIVREDKPGIRSLTGYVVLEGSAAESPDLKQHLRDCLPPHMVPANLVVLDEIPLTPHGKLDRRSLPAPSDDGSREVVLPRTEQERLLAEVWADLLHQEQVSADDNFFELGGDSLLSIELVSRLGQRDWRCTPAQVFQHQTLAELAAVLVPTEPPTVEEEIDQGNVALTPIQHWFFDLQLDQPSYFNQSLLLEVPQGLQSRALEKTVSALVDHHDALRLRFHRDDDRWYQAISSEPATSVFASYDLSQLSDVEQAEQIERRCAQAQAGLDLQSGPVLRVVHFELGKHHSSRLLLCLHHLVVDPYSWRILLDDLLAGYQQAAASQRIMLPPKTTSFASWARRLSLLANEPRIQDSRNYWQQELAGDQPHQLVTDREAGDNRFDSAQQLRVALSSEETDEFLRRAAGDVNSAVSHLSAALAIAYRRWADSPLLVDIERHGRDPIAEDVDVSRTVGWFVAMHPLLLDHASDESEAATLERLQQRLRDLPDQGIGYGLLRYLDSNGGSEWSDVHADVRLNYLGRLDHVARGQAQTQIQPRQFGNQQAADSRRPHLLEIDARIDGETLVVDWTYSSNLHHLESMEQLSQQFIAALRRLLAPSA